MEKIAIMEIAVGVALMATVFTIGLWRAKVLADK